MNIAILDGYALNPGDLSWEQLRQYGNIAVYDRTPPHKIIECATDSDIVITNKVPFDASTIEQLPKLKCIVVTATGYNIIDTEAASKRNIIVCNAPAYSTMSVAQHVFALLLHISTHVADYAESNRGGKWGKSPDFCYINHPTLELADKTIGIIGLGSIGSRVAAIANSFGMKVIALTSKTAEQLPEHITCAELDGLLSQSDIISIHCPLTPSTKHLINRNTIKKMKRGAILINTSRGNLVNEQDVSDALSDGHLAAFGGDVLSTEPPAENNPLLKAPNSFLTPHIAWATKEARQRLMDITTDNVKSFIENNPINVVNQ